MVTNGSRN